MTLPDDAPSIETLALAGGAVLTTLIAAEPGPTVVLLGGVHGDEDEGVLAVRRVRHEVLRAPLRGQLRTVAPAHPVAWAPHTRTSPLDGANLARSFPGDEAGSPTEVLARALTDEVIGGADLLVDLHSAGSHYAMPTFCGYGGEPPLGPVAARAAHAFGAPLIWCHPSLERGRSLSAAAELGIPAIYAECNGGSGILAGDLDLYVRGVLSVLSEWRMLPPSFAAPCGPGTRHVYGAGDLDAGEVAERDGLFVSSTRAGAEVGEGEELGRFYDYDGRLLALVKASRPGMVMFLRRRARTERGAVLYVLADLEPAAP